MLCRSILLFLLLVTSLAKEQISGIPNLDYIYDSLSKQVWDTDEVHCREKVFNILENVRNSTLWATWVWNSFDQSPTGAFFGARYHLGAYDQCLRPPWLATHPELRTQYCLAEIEMNKDGPKRNAPVSDPYGRAEKYYLDTNSRFSRSFSYMAYGICLPAGCPSKSAEKFVKALLSTGYLQAAQEAPVSIHHCEEGGVTHQYSWGFYVYIYTFATLLSIAVAATYYVCEFPVTASSNSFVNHVAKSFCLRRNWGTVFKADKDELTCLYGIRFLTATIIAIIHTLTFAHGTSVINALDFELLPDTRPIFTILAMHFDVFVDTFFAISALLMGMRIATMDITKPYNFIKNIVKRYLRLIGPFAVTVLYMTHVLMHTDDGPLYPLLAKVEQQACEKTWWLSLLMVGNYFNTSNMCYTPTWYIPCDFHFHAITLVLLYVYRKDPNMGKVAAAVVLLIGIMAPAITTYLYNLPAVMVCNMGSEINVRSNKVFKYGYSQTHNRMGPYVVGLAVGYIMSIYKPKDYKKVWSKTVSFFGAFVSLCLMVAVLAVGLMFFVHRIQGLLAGILMTVDRTTFAVAVLGVIIFCTYGDVPLINSFLSWPVFAPLSRLSYGLYVIHVALLYQKTSAVRNNLVHNLFELLMSALGLVVVALAISLVVWLLVEAPLINITDRYLNTKSAAIEKEETSKTGVDQNDEKQKNT